jgi:hypothetical protein
MPWHTLPFDADTAQHFEMGCMYVLVVSWACML